MNNDVNKKRAKARYHVPVIGHFADRSVRFSSILEAEAVTGISYTLIFEACIGKIHKARNVYWEYENGRHYIKYKAHYMRMAHLIQEEGEHGHGHGHGHGKSKKNDKAEELPEGH